jgi:hypothetical protein
MTSETLEDLLEHVRGRMTKKTTSYTVEDACLLQRDYKNAQFIKAKY